MTRLAPYLLVGLVVWVCVLKSGVHATLAGVVVALFVPLRTESEGDFSLLKHVEHELAPWVTFGVMPIFAFANAGVVLHGLSISDLYAGIPLGVAAGLFVGKQIGIMSAVWLGVKLRLARLPDGVTWLQIYGVSLLAGVGFTMSLFIGTLAFSDPENAAAVRIGVLTGSVMSALLGFVILRLSVMNQEEANNSKTPNQRNEPAFDSAS